MCICENFRNNLVKYINGGCLTRRDLVPALLFPEYLFKQNAARITRFFEDGIASNEQTNLFPHIFKIGFYKGENTSVLSMIDYLQRNLEEDLIGAYVHGSLGTYEEIAFSDFDAIVILKNEVFNSPTKLTKVAKKLNKARTIMYDFDPLQHHGWFVLTKMDLDHYPEYYFPKILFRYAKSLLKKKGLELEIYSDNSNKIRYNSFESISNRLKRYIENKHYPRNMYQLKGLLSQFMLLPTLYLQARYHKGIFKKFSFSEAQKDFSPKDWSIMNEVSSIRLTWHYKMSKAKKWIMTQPNYFGRFFARHFSPTLSKEISSMLTSDFFVRMKTLINSMHDKINE